MRECGVVVSEGVGDAVPDGVALAVGVGDTVPDNIALAVGVGDTAPGGGGAGRAGCRRR